MSGEECVILVINRLAADGKNLKELIEFMDTPNVHTAAPEQWRQVLNERRLEALFVGSDLSADEVDTLLVDIREFDPNVPIVMMDAGEPT